MTALQYMTKHAEATAAPFETSRRDGDQYKERPETYISV
jgi:hypothetical protein